MHEQRNDENRLYKAKHLKANYYPINDPDLQKTPQGKIVRAAVKNYGETTTATGNMMMVTHPLLEANAQHQSRSTNHLQEPHQKTGSFSNNSICGDSTTNQQMMAMSMSQSTFMKPDSQGIIE